MIHTYDVFVSYAKRNDTPKRNPWITGFVEHLKDYLLQRIAKREIKFWMDRNRLDGNDQLTPEITSAVKNTAVFLMFHSPQYQASAWCKEEVRIFLDHAADPTRVFLVELNDKASRPTQLTDMRGYRFWDYEDDGKTQRLLAYPDFDDERDRQYNVRLNTLADEMANRLAELQSPSGTRPPPSIADHPKTMPNMLEELLLKQLKTSSIWDVRPNSIWDEFIKDAPAAKPSQHKPTPTPLPPPQPPSLAELLPGAWTLQIIYPGGIAGQGTVQMFANGAFQVEGLNPIVGAYRIQGTWQTIGPTQILLQGQQTVGFQVLPFYSTVQFFQTTQRMLTSAMSTGEQLTWQRVG